MNKDRFVVPSVIAILTTIVIAIGISAVETIPLQFHIDVDRDVYDWVAGQHENIVEYVEAEIRELFEKEYEDNIDNELLQAYRKAAIEGTITQKKQIIAYIDNMFPEHEMPDEIFGDSLNQ